MRLARRLLLHLILVVGLLLASSAFIQVFHELGALTSDMARDHRVVVAALRWDLEAAWSQGGPTRAQAVLDDFGREHGLELRWRDPGAPAPERRVLEGGAWLGALVGGEVPPVLTSVPLAVASDEVGTVDVFEPGAEAVGSIRRSILHAALENVAVGCGIAAVMWILGRRHLARPLDALVHQARRIGDGDFKHPVGMTGQDELGHLSRELDTTAARLDRAYVALQAETEARIRAIDALRHADRLATVGRLAAGLAHELGTPLTIISMQAGELMKPDSERMRLERAWAISGEADRMTALVRQLLDFARRSHSERTRRNPAEIMRTTAESLRPLIEQRNVGLEVHVGTTPEIELDATQLSQVLTNLIVNALQATPSGGVVRVEVDQTLRARGDLDDPLIQRCVTFTVEDTGSGMGDDVLPHLFEPFFTTKPVGQGTGLGLAVAHGIVTDHGGWIDVASKPGLGSTFSVHLPVEWTEG